MQNLHTSVSLGSFPILAIYVLDSDHDELSQYTSVSHGTMVTITLSVTVKPQKQLVTDSLGLEIFGM